MQIYVILSFSGGISVEDTISPSFKILGLTPYLLTNQLLLMNLDMVYNSSDSIPNLLTKQKKTISCIIYRTCDKVEKLFFLSTLVASQITYTYQESQISSTTSFFMCSVPSGRKRSWILTCSF